MYGPISRFLNSNISFDFAMSIFGGLFILISPLYFIYTYNFLSTLSGFVFLIGLQYLVNRSIGYIDNLLFHMEGDKGDYIDTAIWASVVICTFLCLYFYFELHFILALVLVIPLSFLGASIAIYAGYFYLMFLTGEYIISEIFTFFFV